MFSMALNPCTLTGRIIQLMFMTLEDLFFFFREAFYVYIVHSTVESHLSTVKKSVIFEI